MFLPITNYFCNFCVIVIRNFDSALGIGRTVGCMYNFAVSYIDTHMGYRAVVTDNIPRLKLFLREKFSWCKGAAVSRGSQCLCRCNAGY